MKLISKINTVILLFVLLATVVFAYAWVNAGVSYKYEVQDYMLNGDNPEELLSLRQKQIIQNIALYETLTKASLIVLLSAIVVRIINLLFSVFNGKKTKNINGN